MKGTILVMKKLCVRNSIDLNRWTLSNLHKDECKFDLLLIIFTKRFTLKEKDLETIGSALILFPRSGFGSNSAHLKKGQLWEL